MVELKAVGYHNAEIEQICAKLGRYEHVRDRYPDIAPVAFLGASGVGKSSTTNSILHQNGVSHETDSASRGTNIVHEYAMPCTFQTSMFQVSAPYLRESQIANLVHNHYQSILAHLLAVEDDDTDDMQETRQDYETALNFFRVLLCNTDDFADDDAATEYFKSTLETDADETIQHLTSLIEEFKSTRKLKDCVEYHDAENCKELGNIFKTVSRVPRGVPSSPYPWPILSKVGIHHENDLLNAGVVIGDTPGVDDNDQSMVQATKRYIKKAGTVLVFTKFDRGATSDVLDAHLTECIGLGKLNDVRLIVTNIDGKKIKEDKYDDLNWEDRNRLAEARNLTRQLKETEAKIHIDKLEARKERDWDRLDLLETQLDELPQKIAFAEAKEEQVAVDIKCREDFEKQVKGKLQKLYKGRAPDLPIHFVSNAEYQKHLRGYDAKKPPSLDIEATGIPALRRTLYAIPARGKANTLARTSKTLLPSIFGSIIGVLTKSKLERKNDVSKLIEDVLCEHSRFVEHLSADVKEAFAERVLQIYGTHQSPSNLKRSAS